MPEWKVPLGNVQLELVRGLQDIKGKQRWVDVDRKAGVVKLPKGSTCGDVSNIAELVRHVAAVGGTVAPGARAATLLDMGCGVASLDAAVADKGAATNDALAMHVHDIGVAPIDQHFGQTQLVAERGVPLLVGAVTPLWRLPFPMGAFDLVYCCWCRLSGEAVAVQVAQLLKAGGHFIIDDQGEHVSLVLGREPMRFCLERAEVPYEMLAGLPREMVVFRRMPSAECQEAQARVVGGAVPLPPCEPSALLGGDGTVQACLPELGEDGLRATAAPANGAGAVMLPARAALAWLSARARACAADRRRRLHCGTAGGRRRLEVAGYHCGEPRAPRGARHGGRLCGVHALIGASRCPTTRVPMMVSSCCLTMMAIAGMRVRVVGCWIAW